ncbi:MAG TPA: acyltransferase domain-containing protein, partial [Polyangium sp.]|nr:acyltransferase domain-containing protein [Polyangium sp.]
VLKRLSDAERDGDTILALIRGSAVNQDGRSTGLTAPNVLSQQALLRQALESARLGPADIGYLETHGTGTSLGDPIEVEAIKAVFGGPRERGATCVLGALKSNIGHLEAAAGVAGLIKVVLAMQNERIPGNLHFRSLNPRIDLRGTPLEIAQTPKEWSAGVRPRYAGVSSFGISGTNAHVIVEEPPRNLEEALFEEEVSTCLLPISAKTPEALREHARAFHEMLSSAQGPKLLDIVYTASARRTHYLHRISVVGKTKEELTAHLAAYLEGKPSRSVAQGQSTPARAKVVFVFSGQGSQWLGMGRQLYDSDSSFRSVIDTCDNLMTARLGWSILDELDSTAATSRLDETQVAQPLLFAVQIALVEMLRSWGIAPDAMIGHSVGEIAAAHIAGILSLDEAIRLVAIRGRIMQKATGMGKMVAVSMTAEQVHGIMAGYEDRVAIAAINSPTSIVLSGAPSAIDDMIIRCEKSGFSSRLLPVNYAFHSPQMDPFEYELVERLVRVDTRRATLAMYSTVIADCVDGKELDARYWGRNIRATVDFAGAMFAAIRDGYQLFLELSPHPVLSTNIQQCLEAKKADGTVHHAMRRNHDQRSTLLEAIGALYTHGCSPEWARVVPGNGKTVPLPTYPWQGKRHWIQSVANPAARLASQDKGGYLLTGTPLEIPGEILHQVLNVSLLRQSYLKDHVVHGEVVVPGAFYVAVLLAIAADRFKAHAATLRDVLFVAPLALNGEVNLHTVLVPKSPTSYDFTVLSKKTSVDSSAQDFQEHGRGQLLLEAPTMGEPKTEFDIVEDTAPTLDIEDFFRKLSLVHLDWGPQWRWIRSVSTWNDYQRATLTPALGTGPNDAPLHPALIDNGFVTALFQFEKDLGVDVTTPHLSFAIKELRWFSAPVGNARVLFKAATNTSNETAGGDLTIVSETGDVVCEIDAFTLKRASKDAFFREAGDNVTFVQMLHSVPVGAANLAPMRNTRWILFCASTLQGEEIKSQLAHSGISVSCGPMFDQTADGAIDTPLCKARDSASYLDSIQQAWRDGELTGVVCFWNNYTVQSFDEVFPLQAEQNALVGLHVMH